MDSRDSVLFINYPRPPDVRGVMASSTAPAATEQEEEMEVADAAEEEQKEFLPGYLTLQDYSKVGNVVFTEFTFSLLYIRALLSVVMKATKCSNALPDEGDEFDYYSSYPGFKTFSSRVGARLNRM